jgi:hypothetical protein
VRQAKAIVVAIAKNVAAEVQATARIFVALAFIRASGVKLGKEIAAAIAKSAEDNRTKRCQAFGTQLIILAAAGADFKKTPKAGGRAKDDG